MGGGGSILIIIIIICLRYPRGFGNFYPEYAG